MAKPGLCAACGTRLPAQTRGRPRKYCTDPQCRAKAQKDRRMARKPDTPCSVCGELTWTGRGSASAEQRICQPCRRNRRPMITYTCGYCGETFTSTQLGRKYCSQRCSMRAYVGARPQAPTEIAELKQLIRQYPEEAEEIMAEIKKQRRRRVERDRERDRTGAVGRKWEEARAKVKARREPCQICGHPIDWDAPPRSRWSFSVDHIIPRSRGGDPYAQSNLRTAHYGCNASRGNGTKRMRKIRQQRREPSVERW